MLFKTVPHSVHDTMFNVSLSVLHTSNNFTENDYTMYERMKCFNSLVKNSGY